MSVGDEFALVAVIMVVVAVIIVLVAMIMVVVAQKFQVGKTLARGGHTHGLRSYSHDHRCQVKL